MVERRSLSYLILLAGITLVVGSLLYQALDPVASGFMNRSDYQPNNGTAFESPVGPSIGLTQAWVKRLWTLAPVLLIVAVTTSLVIAGRRGRGKR
jgi:hypothetical protein